MKLLIAENDDDRAALMAAAGLTVTVTETVSAELTTPNGWAATQLAAIKADLDTYAAEDMTPDADADDAIDAVRVAEPSGGPFGGGHVADAPVVAQGGAQRQRGATGQTATDIVTALTALGPGDHPLALIAAATVTIRRGQVVKGITETNASQTCLKLKRQGVLESRRRGWYRLVDQSVYGDRLANVELDA